MIAQCRQHRRTVVFEKPHRFLITDEAAGEIEQFWHPGERLERLDEHTFRVGQRALLRLDPSLEVAVVEGWRSAQFGKKEPVPVIRGFLVSGRSVRLKTVLEIGVSG